MAGPMDVVIRFIGDTKSLRNEVSQVEGTGSKLKKWAGGIGATIAAGFAIKAVTDFTAAASDLNESMSKVGVVFGAASDQVVNWSKNSAEAMGLSQQQALEAAGTYGNLAVALGLPVQQAAKMSTSLVGLASDLSSFNNVPIDEVLQALQSGLVGEVEPLRRFGVSLNQSRIEAEALRLGLAKAPVDMEKVALATQRLELAQGKAAAAAKKYGKDSEEAKRANVAVASAQGVLDKALAGGKVKLTEAAKAQAAYSLIMHDTKTAQGDFARTSDGLANSQRIMGARWKDLQATMGKALLPVMLKLVSVLILVMDNVGKLGDALAAMGRFIKDNAVVLGLLTAALIAANVATIANAISMGILTVQIIALSVAQKAAAVAQWLLNAAMTANPIGLIVAGIILVVAAFVLAYQKIGWFRDLVQAVWGWIRANWPLLVAIMTGPIGVITLLIVKNWTTIRSVIQTVVSAILGFLRTLGSAFMTLATTIGGAITTAVKWVTGLPGKVLSVVSQMLNAGRSIGDAFLDGIRNGLTAAGGFAGDVASGLVRVVKDAWNRVADMINDFVPNDIGFGPFKLDLPDNPIPHFAKGGIVTGPTLAMIGERGPEAVVPLSGASAGAIGNTYYISVSVPPVVDPTVVGRSVVAAIQSFERANGRAWRTSPT